jgi:2,3-dihydroxybenzoate decarboxylase
MQGKIAFEEHFALEETLEETRNFAGDSGTWDDFARQILDLEDERLQQMDETGIDFAILSLNAPGVQRILDAKEAMNVAKKANERMAEAVAKHPLCGARGLADARPRRRVGRAHSLRPAVGLQGLLGERFSASG